MCTTSGPSPSVHATNKAVDDIQESLDSGSAHGRAARVVASITLCIARLQPCAYVPRLSPSLETSYSTPSYGPFLTLCTL
eukprot:4247327-Pyramimonas_sp.AAC.1